MALDPRPGLVIRYDFLWKDEHRRGQEHGRKDRPCAIILVARAQEDGAREVVLCPITHAPPEADQRAVEVPPKVAAHLGLDAARCWIKTHEVNTLTSEKDRLPFGVTPATPDNWAFGLLPHKLAAATFEQVRLHARRRRLATTRRDRSKKIKR